MIKIMKAEPEIPDDEIRRHMDFDNLLAKRKQVIQKSRYTTTAWIISGIMLIGVLGWLIQQPHAVFENRTEDNNPLIQLTPEVSDSVVLESTTSSREKTEPEKVKSEITTIKKNTSALIDSGSEIRAEKRNVEQSYLPAEPVEGYPHLYAYFNANLVYPVEALKDSIEGAQVVNFIINKEGKPEDIRVDNSLGPLFDAEAIRLIKQMPLWKPASLNNKPVKSRISIPLTFQLEKINRK